jgi:shikimate kinase
MSLILVTGISGTGKSAVCEELQRRGYESHDTDLDGNAVWVHRETGEVVASGEGDRRPPGWLDVYGWQVVPSRVEAIAPRATGRLAFLCGSIENDKDVWRLFSKVIYLTVDEDTLHHRLETRTSNDFGRYPEELAAILKWHKVGADLYRSLGASIVDTTRPFGDVVDEVINIASSHGPTL